MSDNNKKTALVTGASRGIGKAIAKVLSKNFNVILTYASKKDEADNVVKEIESLGGTAAAYQLDVSNGEAVSKFFSEVVKDADLEVLVNNAGITKDGLILRMKDEDFEQVINTNLKGAFLCSR